MRAEWAKTRSDRGTGWLLAALVVLSVAVSILTIGASRCPAAGCTQDPARISLTGVYLGQAVAAVAGVLAIGNEYGSGMIRVTLMAIPRRGRLLAAKAVVLAGPVAAAAALAVGASMVTGLVILPGHGFTSALGFDLAGAAAWRASLFAVAYLTLVAVLALGVTAVVRDSAAAIGIVLGLLYMFPIIGTVVTDQSVQRLLRQVGPMPAGMDALATVGLHGQPPHGQALTPWQGLGVVALWAVGALVLGGAVLRMRDA